MKIGDSLKAGDFKQTLNRGYIEGHYRGVYIALKLWRKF